MAVFIQTEVKAVPVSHPAGSEDLGMMRNLES